MNKELLRWINVNYHYPSGKEALKNINFSITKGELIFLTGHSGAGKSTLLRLTALLDKPTQGQIFFNNQCVNQLSSREILGLRRQMGIVLQKPHLLWQRTVQSNVALPLFIAGYSGEEIKRRTQAALEKVGLGKKALRLPSQLSAGEQIRVTIARALVISPMLLIADEPTGNLDPRLSKELLHLLRRLNDHGMTVLIATHDLALLEGLPYRHLVLRKGCLVNEMPLHKLSHS